MASSVPVDNGLLHQVPRFEREHGQNQAGGSFSLPSHDPGVPDGYSLPDVEADSSDVSPGSASLKSPHVGAAAQAAAMGATS